MIFQIINYFFYSNAISIMKISIIFRGPEIEGYVCNLVIDVGDVVIEIDVDNVQSLRQGQGRRIRFGQVPIIVWSSPMIKNTL